MSELSKRNKWFSKIKSGNDVMDSIKQLPTKNTATLPTFRYAIIKILKIHVNRPRTYKLQLDSDGRIHGDEQDWQTLTTTPANERRSTTNPLN